MRVDLQSRGECRQPPDVIVVAVRKDHGCDRLRCYLRDLGQELLALILRWFWRQMTITPVRPTIMPLLPPLAGYHVDAGRQLFCSECRRRLLSQRQQLR